MRRHALQLARLRGEDSGQDLIEYALVACLLSLCAVASLHTLASKLVLVFQGIASGLDSAI